MSLPNCLLGIVGSRDEDISLPSAFGLYVEALPGITTDLLNSIRPKDYDETPAWLTEVFTAATLDFISELDDRFRPRFRHNAMLDNFSVGKIPKGSIQYKTATELNRGVKFTRCRENVFGLFAVSVVRVLINNTGTFNLKITDNLGFSQEYEFESEAGIPVEVIVDYSSDAGEIFITLNPTDGEESPESVLPADLQLSLGCGSCATHSGWAWKAQGWDGVKASSSTFGLSLNASYQCDQMQLACMFRSIKAFQMGLWYKMGIAILTNAIYTDRMNPKTLHRAEAMEVNRSEMEEKMELHLDTLRETTLPALARLSPCISCNQPMYVDGSTRRML